MTSRRRAALAAVGAARSSCGLVSSHLRTSPRSAGARHAIFLRCRRDLLTNPTGDLRTRMSMLALPSDSFRRVAFACPPDAMRPSGRGRKGPCARLRLRAAPSPLAPTHAHAPSTAARAEASRTRPRWNEPQGLEHKQWTRHHLKSSVTSAKSRSRA